MTFCLRYLTNLIFPITFRLYHTITIPQISKHKSPTTIWKKQNHHQPHHRYYTDNYGCKLRDWIKEKKKFQYKNHNYDHIHVYNFHLLSKGAFKLSFILIGSIQWLMALLLTTAFRMEIISMIKWMTCLSANMEGVLNWISLNVINFGDLSLSMNYMVRA